jgi:hypothetical protein
MASQPIRPGLETSPPWKPQIPHVLISPSSSWGIPNARKMLLQTVTHACRKRRLKWVPIAWGYNWATLPLEDINTQRPGPPRWGLGVGLTKLPCKKRLLRNLQEIQLSNGRRLWRRPRSNLSCGAKGGGGGERERVSSDSQACLKSTCSCWWKYWLIITSLV